MTPTPSQDDLEREAIERVANILGMNPGELVVVVPTDVLQHLLTRATRAHD